MDIAQETKENDESQAAALAKEEEYKFFKQIAQQQAIDRTTTLSIELTNATGTYLDHLNDDCLLEIFSQDSLTPMDLLSLAETCKLFTRVTRRLFPKELDFECDYAQSKFWIKSYKPTYFCGDLDGAHDAERIFKHFGICLIMLSVEKFNVMNLVAKYCVGGTLKQLRIKSLNISAALSIELNPIFQQLRSISLSDTIIECNASLFKNCDSLHQLKFVTQPNFDEIFEHNFPKLERLIFFRNNIQLQYDFDPEQTLLNFLERHKTLKFLDLYTPLIEGMDDVLRKLNNSCKELEELELQFCERLETTLCFPNFQCLKRLKLNFCYGYGFASIIKLQKLRSLEALIICEEVDGNELFAALPMLVNLRELDAEHNLMTRKVPWTSLSQLTKLRISSRYLLSIDNVVDIVRELTNLEVLDIHCTIRERKWYEFELSLNEFREIVELVKHRRNVLKLKCSLGFSKFSESYLRICPEDLKVKLIKHGLPTE